MSPDYIYSLDYHTTCYKCGTGSYSTDKNTRVCTACPPGT